MLDRRTMLSGDVSVTFNGAALFVTGDEAGNDISIDVDGANGNVAITGSNGTTVNGQPALLLEAAGLKRILADMGAGNDSLAIAGVSDPPMELDQLVDMKIELGAGDDAFELRHLAFSQWVLVNADDGDDFVVVDGITTGHNLRVRGEDGDDSISSNNNVINRNMVLSGGLHVDEIFLTDTNVAGTARIRGGRGSQYSEVHGVQIGGDLYFNGSNDADVLAVYDTSIGVNLNINGDGGDDLLGIAYDVRVAEKTRLQGDGGDDFLSSGSNFGPGGVFRGQFWAHGGGDDDVVSICYGSTYQDNLKLIGGGGNRDLLALENPPPVVDERFVVRRFETEVESSPFVADRLFELIAEANLLFGNGELFTSVDPDLFVCGDIMPPPGPDDIQGNDLSSETMPASPAMAPLMINGSLNYTGFVGQRNDMTFDNSDAIRIPIAAATSDDTIIKLLFENTGDSTIGISILDSGDGPQRFAAVTGGQTVTFEELLGDLNPSADRVLTLLISGEGFVDSVSTTSSTTYDLTLQVCPPAAMATDDVRANDLSNGGDPMDISTAMPVTIEPLQSIGGMVTETGFVSSNSGAQTDTGDAILIPVDPALLADATGNVVRLTLEATGDQPVQFSAFTRDGSTFAIYDSSTATPGSPISYNIDPAIVSTAIDGVLLRVLANGDMGAGATFDTTYRIKAELVPPANRVIIDDRNNDISNSEIVAIQTQPLAFGQTTTYSGFVAWERDVLQDYSDSIKIPLAPTTVPNVAVFVDVYTENDRFVNLYAFQTDVQDTSSGASRLISTTLRNSTDGNPGTSFVLPLDLLYDPTCLMLNLTHVGSFVGNPGLLTNYDITVRYGQLDVQGSDLSSATSTLELFEESGVDEISGFVGPGDSADSVRIGTTAALLSTDQLTVQITNDGANPIRVSSSSETGFVGPETTVAPNSIGLLNVTAPPGEFAFDAFPTLDFLIESLGNTPDTTPTGQPNYRIEFNGTDSSLPDIDTRGQDLSGAGMPFQATTQPLVDDPDLGETRLFIAGFVGNAGADTDSIDVYTVAFAPATTIPGPVFRDGAQISVRGFSLQDTRTEFGETRLRIRILDGSNVLVDREVGSREFDAAITFQVPYNTKPNTLTLEVQALPSDFENDNLLQTYQFEVYYIAGDSPRDYSGFDLTDANTPIEADVQVFNSTGNNLELVDNFNGFIQGGTDEIDTYRLNILSPGSSRFLAFGVNQLGNTEVEIKIYREVNGVRTLLDTRRDPPAMGSGNTTDGIEVFDNDVIFIEVTPLNAATEMGETNYAVGVLQFIN